ncbi:MAG: thioredoxin family protein [Imperialibacter sp.]|uniref:thioredoxin family protein n=1 Tax=Imperialibacter sp. TaxID=2038411 RepID=UPI003A880E37
MKQLILLLGIAVTGILIASNSAAVDFEKNSEKGIQFRQVTWVEALEAAKKEDRLIFIDVYATWCGPCKAMKARTFSDEKAGDVFNQRFVNIAVDGESAEGLELVGKFGVRAYPTLLFVGADEKLVGGAEGYHTTDQLLSLSKNVK